MDSQFSAQVIAVSDNLGPPMALYQMPKELAARDIVVSHASVAMALSGKGERVYRRASRARTLYTAPRMIEVSAAGYEIDEAWWQNGLLGEVIKLDLDAALLGRLLGDPAALRGLGTHHEVFDAQIEAMMHLLWNESSGSSGGGTLYRDGLTMALIGLLVSKFDQPRTRLSSLQGLTQAQRRNVLEFIEENLALDLSIDQLAKAAQLAPDRFARAFKHSFNVPPHAYVLGRRIERASRLMRDKPAMPLVDIAASTGFSTQAHFTQAFKSKVGVPPGVWKRGG